MFQVLTNIENVYNNYENNENIEYKVATDENYRPKIPFQFLNDPKYEIYINLMKSCWLMDPEKRPSFFEAKNILLPLINFKKQ